MFFVSYSLFKFEFCSFFFFGYFVMLTLFWGGGEMLIVRLRLRFWISKCKQSLSCTCSPEVKLLTSLKYPSCREYNVFLWLLSSPALYFAASHNHIVEEIESFLSQRYCFPAAMIQHFTEFVNLRKEARSAGFHRRPGIEEWSLQKVIVQWGQTAKSFQPQSTTFRQLVSILKESALQFSNLNKRRNLGENKCTWTELNLEPNEDPQTDRQWLSLGDFALNFLLKKSKTKQQKK